MMHAWWLIDSRQNRPVAGPLGSIYVTVPPVMKGLLIGQRCWISAAGQHTHLRDMRLRAVNSTVNSLWAGANTSR